MVQVVTHYAIIVNKDCFYCVMRVCDREITIIIISNILKPNKFLVYVHFNNTGTKSLIESSL